MIASWSRYIAPLGFGLAAFFVLENPQLRTPVRERETQPLQIGMSRANLCFDFRDLAVASRDSCRDSDAFGLDLLECPVVAI